MFQLQTFEFSPIQENTYLLYNELNDCIIIDPGCYFEEEREMLATFIESKKLNPILLLNTHCHLDHVFGNKFVAETYGLIPHIHPLEKKLLEYAPTSGLMYNMPFDNYSGSADGWRMPRGGSWRKVVGGGLAEGCWRKLRRMVRV